MGSEFTAIERDSPAYPGNLELYLGEDAPETVYAVGNLAILDNGKTALFCSSRCPGAAVNGAVDLAQQLRAAGRTVIGGFHSPMEKACFDILLRSPHPVVLCPARGLGGMQIRGEWRRPIAEERMLILSPFSPDLKRATAQEAVYRNLFAGALADDVVIPHAEPGSKVARLRDRIREWGKPVIVPELGGL